MSAGIARAEIERETTMEAIKTVVAGRTFFIDPCPECGQAEVRIREEDGTAYGVCPCCDGVSAFPDEHVREYAGCSICGDDISRSVFAVGTMCPNCAAIEERSRREREQGFCPDCGTRLQPHPIGGHLACPMAGL